MAGWLILILVALIGFGWLCRAVLDSPRGEVDSGLYWHLSRLYARVVHRLRLEGLENVPRGPRPGPLIIVANHTSGVDPVLVQAACRFEIRWIMASDMRHPLGEGLWDWGRIIFVGRDGGGAAGTREALRHLREGGVLGIFPEGGIERPPRQIRPFLPGVGFIVKRSGAPVLPVLVDGTPQVDPAWQSLRRFSRSVIRFLPPIDYRSSQLEAPAIAEDLRRRFIEWTGWPASSDEPGRIRPRTEETPATMPFPRAAGPTRRMAGA